MKAPTERQKEALSFIDGIRLSTGAYPTLTDIAERFGFSRNAAFELISSMEKKGLVEKTKNGGIVLPEKERIAMENVRISEIREDGTEGSFWVPRGLGPASELFSWRVSSEEMKNAGILPGDEAIFTRDLSTLRNGDIVLSRREDGEKLYLRRRIMRPDGFTDLVPENDTLGKMTTKDPEILGRMIRLIRRY